MLLVWLYSLLRWRKELHSRVELEPTATWGKKSVLLLDCQHIYSRSPDVSELFIHFRKLLSYLSLGQGHVRSLFELVCCCSNCWRAIMDSSYHLGFVFGRVKFQAGILRPCLLLVEVILKLFPVFDGLDVLKEFSIICKHCKVTGCYCIWKIINIHAKQYSTKYDVNGKLVDVKPWIVTRCTR